MRAILSATLMLCIVAVAANAGINVTCYLSGTYTVTTTTGTFTVQQWAIGASTNNGAKITAFELYGMGPLVQVWRWEQNELIDPETEEPYDPPQYENVYTSTPTMNNQSTTSNARNADTHFLFSNNQMINVTAPTETNDLSKGSTGSSFPKRAWGLGTNRLVDINAPVAWHQGVSFRGACTYDSSVQSTSMMIAQLCIPKGSDFADFAVQVWAGSESTTYFTTLTPYISNSWVQAGGSYAVGPGGQILLQGTVGELIDGLPGMSYAWDLDGDGAFDDAAGRNPVLTYDYLTSTLGLSQGKHVITFWGGGGAVLGDDGRIDVAELTIIPEPVTLALLGLGGATLLRKRRRAS